MRIPACLIDLKPLAVPIPNPPVISDSFLPVAIQTTLRRDIGIKAEDTPS